MSVTNKPIAQHRLLQIDPGRCPFLLAKTIQASLF
jgi:hypothetical protein